MDNLIEYLNIAKNNIHPLITCAIMHHRFEAIHPFEDGNGRTGRLLISLHLIDSKILDMPILFPSGYFEKNKKRYIESLGKVDVYEDWYTWILFFLRGIENQAKVALNAGIEIDKLLKDARGLLVNENAYMNLIRVLEYSFVQAYLTAPLLQKELNIPTSSGSRYLAVLSKLNVLEDLGVENKKRIYRNTKLLNILKNI